jgi:hypothetical protein
MSSYAASVVEFWRSLFGQSSVAYLELKAEGEGAYEDLRTPSQPRRILQCLLILPAVVLGLGAGLILAPRQVAIHSVPVLNDTQEAYFEPALNRFMTEEQCEATFPNLNQEAERSSRYWQEERGGITEADVQRAQEATGGSGTRVLIYNNRVRRSLLVMTRT